MHYRVFSFSQLAADHVQFFRCRISAYEPNGINLIASRLEFVDSNLSLTEKAIEAKARSVVFQRTRLEGPKSKSLTG